MDLQIPFVMAKIQGGLGNQMFQYAAARSVAYHQRACLRLHLCSNASDQKRAYQLEHFNIEADIASPEELRGLCGGSPDSWDHGIPILQAHPRSSSLRVIKERSFLFDAKLLSLAGNIYLDGYWQSEKYFERIQSLIRRELSLKDPLTGKNLELSRMIETTHSVSVHVRRGDYVTDNKTHVYHGVCTLQYYKEAAERILQQVPKPHYFLFSDDPIWTREHLAGWMVPSTVVAHNCGHRDYEDLRLMSMCKHHITANSSFSWWGAWLASDEHRIVYAPRQWFGAAGLDTKDLIPESWTRI